MRRFSWAMVPLLAAACVPNPPLETTTGTGSGSGSGGGDCVTLVKGEDTSVPTPGLPRPALNVPYTDEHYHLTVTRVTEASQVKDGDLPTRVRHEYSRRPAFNVDSTLALEDSSNGWFRLYQVNANGTFEFLKTLSLNDNDEPNWDATDPDKLYFFESNGSGLTISTYDVANNQKSVSRDLGARVKALFPNATGMWTKGEGRPSDDGKIWCVEVGHTVQPENTFVADGLVSYNMATDTILGHMSVTETPDHISTSPKGDYCVPSWGLPLGTRAYKTDFSSYTQLQDRTEHSDLALTKAGEEVYVYSAYDGKNAGFVTMVRLSDGVTTQLFELYGENHATVSMHISGTARNKPGYVVVSLESCTEDDGAIACDPRKRWFNEKIVAVELEPNPRIYNLAHSHAGIAGDFGAAMAVANPDLTRVLFASTWGSTDDKNAHDYLIQVPACALP